MTTEYQIDEDVERSKNSPILSIIPASGWRD
jgi:hypothetical protein